MYIKIDENNRVVMKVTDKFAKDLTVDNATSFLVKTVPAVKSGEVLCFNANIKAFYTESVSVTDEQKEQAKARVTAMRQKENALKWLVDNDWKCNKIIRGEWTTDDPRWIEYLEGATKARQEQDEANAILNQKD